MNAKNDLQEYMVKRRQPVPVYNSIIVGGPQHQPRWQSNVTLADGTHFQGEITLSKTQAEITAAERALAHLKSMSEEPITKPPASGRTLTETRAIPRSSGVILRAPMAPLSNPLPKPTLLSPPVPCSVSAPKLIPPSKSLPIIKVSELSESAHEPSLINYKAYPSRTVLLVDLENLPKLAEEALEVTKDLDIYIFVGMHHCLAAREYPEPIKKIISPSTRPDGTDTCLQVYVGYLLTIQAYDSYLIGTRDHYGSALVEMITQPVLPWMKKEARLVTHISHL